MAGESMHTASKEKMVLHAPAINYRLKSKASIALRCQLCLTRYESRTVQKAPIK